jgi:hypothetical protein
MYLNEDYLFILDELKQRRGNWLNLLNDWLNCHKDFNLMTIPPRELNLRFNLLSRPSNQLCKSNFIDYNNIVDYVLQSSIPYNESSRIKNQILIDSSRSNQKEFQGFPQYYPTIINPRFPVVSNNNFPNLNERNSFPQSPLFLPINRPEMNQAFPYQFYQMPQINDQNQTKFEENVQKNQENMNEAENFYPQYLNKHFEVFPFQPPFPKQQSKPESQNQGVNFQDKLLFSKNNTPFVKNSNYNFESLFEPKK